MKKGSILKLVLGATAMAFGIGAFGIANGKTVAQTKAADSASSSTITDTLFTPGTFIYLNLLSSSWYNGGANRFAFRFVDANSVVVFSEWGVRAYDGNQFYCSKVPEHAGNNSTGAWASVQAVCYTSSSVSPSNDYSATDVQALSRAQTPLITTAVKEIEISSGATINALGTAIRTINAYTTSATFTSTKPDFDACSYWSGSQFLPYTDACCSAVSDSASFSTKINYYWPALKQSYDSLTSNQQGYFVSGTGSKYETINNAISRYDRIYYLHHNSYPTVIVDFAARNPATLSGSSVVVPASSDSSSALVLGGLAAIAVLAAGSYFFVRKKKAD